MIKLREIKDIESKLREAMEAVLAADHSDEDTYEEGVEAALMWVLGQDDDGPL